MEHLELRVFCILYMLQKIVDLIFEGTHFFNEITLVLKFFNTGKIIYKVSDSKNANS